MNGQQAFWIGSAIVTILILVPVMLITVRQRRSRSSQTTRTAWLVAATISGATLFAIAANVNGLIPNATVVDFAALVVTGILTGYFLALGLWPAHPRDPKV